MQQHFMTLFVGGLLALSSASSHADRTGTASLVPSNSPVISPSNVILIIGDGMDDHQITIARNYLKGARGRLTLDAMPVRSSVQVLTVSNEHPQQPVYVADSANSGTSMATGVVTSRGRIATTAKTDRDITTIIELAQRAGLKTGIVTTASVTDATPAVFYAHIDKRFCENPDLMIDGLMYDHFPVECEADTLANGGLGSISEQLAASQLDVILGGGFKHFDLAAERGSKTVLATVLEQARDNNFQILTEASGLTNVVANKKLLGLFSPSTLPTRLQGEGGRLAEQPEKSLLNFLNAHLGSIKLPKPMSCEANPKFASVPSLKQMTEAALAKLANEKGFFLMIESASIDKASHERNACGSIGEVEQLNEALDSALAFAEQSPNTLIIVTADHGQAAQLIPQVSLFSTAAYGALPTASPGSIARIKTPEGSVMGVNYATNESFAEEHTGVNVPLFSNEVGRDLFDSMLTQPDIFEISATFLGLK